MLANICRIILVSKLGDAGMTAELQWNSLFYRLNAVYIVYKILTISGI